MTPKGFPETNVTETPPPEGAVPIVFGEVNCWELAGLHEGRELVCSKPRTLLHYLHSEGTAKASAGNRSRKSHVKIHIVGPVADDGEPLKVAYELSREDFLQSFDASERDALYEGLDRASEDATPYWSRPAQVIRQMLT